MTQTTIFTQEELIWMLNGGVSVSTVAGSKHEYMTEETYNKRYGRGEKDNDSITT